MRTHALLLSAVVLSGATLARPERAVAQLDLGSIGKKAAETAGGATRDKVVKEVNAKLLAEGRKNQCSFKTDSDELMPGCDAKLKNLANTLVEMKKRLQVAKVTDYKFEVSGHTDTRGKAEHNKQLSGKRAAVIVKELSGRGVPANEIISVGMGADKPVVTPDNTPAKQAKNRRYEIQLRF
jgi:outer membrane protein OmpA-like peptidoglycan-associated protein